MLVVLLVHPDLGRRDRLAATLRHAGHAVVAADASEPVPAGLVPDVVVAPPGEEVAGLAAGSPVVRDEGDEAVLAALAGAVEQPPLVLTAARVDRRTGTVFRDGGVISLTDTEAALLAWLAGHAGRVVPREDLLVHVWGYRPTMVTRTVDVTVRRLREKIERDPSAPDHLRTVRGEGYRLDLPRPEGVSRDAVIGLFGRAADLGALEERLGQGPVVTVLGPPGIGKTSLARALLARRDGLFVDLVEAGTRPEVLAAVAAALDLPAGLDDEAIGAALAGRGAQVLVLDNVEQVVDPVAELVAGWRTRAPALRYVLTSRLRVRLPEEQVLDLGPLDPAAATDLLVARARDRRPDWASEPEAREAAEAIAVLLDGVPLALELAAARARVLAPATLLDRLHRSLDLLADDRRDRSARQRTLRGAVQWSWDLLDPAEQTALAHLSVFRGGWDLEAAEAVLPLPGVLDTLEALVDHSLVQRRGDRYDLLPWIRAFAADHLAEPGAARERHGAWFAARTARLRAAADGPGGWDALRALRADRANVIAALEHALGTASPHLGALAIGLFPEWELNEVPAAERLLLEQVPARLRDPGERADVRWVLALLSEGRSATGPDHAREALRDAETSGDDLHRLRALHALGHAQIQASAFDEVAASFEKALAIPVDAPGERIRILAEWGTTLRRRGDLSGALAKLEQAVALAEARRIAPLGSGARGMLASVLMLLRQHSAAEAECLALIEEHQAAGAVATVAVYSGLLGVNLYMSGRAEEALVRLEDSLRLAREIGMGHLEGQDLLHHARANLQLGRFDAALADARQAIAVDRTDGTALDETAATLTFAEVLRELGDRAGCEEAIARALASCAEIGLYRGEVQAAEVLGLARLVAGDRAGARAAFAAPLREPLDSSTAVRLLGWTAVCDLEDAPDEAIVTLDRALELAAGLKNPDTSVEGSLRCWRAAARFAAGDPGAAEDLDAAVPLLAPGWSAAATEALAWWRGLTGAEPPGTPRFTEARIARDLVARLRR